MSRRRRIVRAGGIFACSVFALLLWSKLKLVSGIPKTAYATPDAQAAAEGSPREGVPPTPKSVEPERRAVAPETN